MTLFQLLLNLGVVVAAAVLAIVFPTALTSIAKFFGIGRGADLLLYVSIMAGMLFAVATMRAKARSDARVTELARAVALMEARLAEQQLRSTGPSGRSGEAA